MALETAVRQQEVVDAKVATARSLQVSKASNVHVPTMNRLFCKPCTPFGRRPAALRLLMCLPGTSRVKAHNSSLQAVQTHLEAGLQHCAADVKLAEELLRAEHAVQDQAAWDAAERLAAQQHEVGWRESSLHGTCRAMCSNKCVPVLCIFCVFSECRAEPHRLSNYSSLGKGCVVGCVSRAARGGLAGFAGGLARGSLILPCEPVLRDCQVLITLCLWQSSVSYHCLLEVRACWGPRIVSSHHYLPACIHGDAEGRPTRPLGQHDKEAKQENCCKQPSMAACTGAG